MATINAVGVGLTGQSGTGSFAGTTSPTFVTPTLGVASATSINFGGSALNTYAQSTSWTPVLSFATPGDLTVNYAAQVGVYSRIGNIVVCQFVLAATPTFTTATGNLQISGLPFSVGAAGFGSCLVQAPTFPAGVVAPFLQSVTAQTYFVVGLNGSAAAAAYLTTTQVTTGNVLNLQGTMIYLV